MKTYVFYFDLETQSRSAQQSSERADEVEAEMRARQMQVHVQMQLSNAILPLLHSLVDKHYNRGIDFLNSKVDRMK